MELLTTLTVLLMLASRGLGAQQSLEEEYYYDYDTEEDLKSYEEESDAKIETTTRELASSQVTTPSSPVTETSTWAVTEMTQISVTTARILTAHVAPNFDSEPTQTDNEVMEILLPDNCTGYKMMLIQPALLPVVPIPKCCRSDQSYFFNDTGKGCASSSENLTFELIHGVFYDGCIEDREIKISYEVYEKPPCDGGMLYNRNYGDTLYVLSNGSLLRVSNDWEEFDVFDDYCIDMMFESGSFALSAISCRDKDLPVLHVSAIQAMICAIFMMISVPCLIIVAGIYFTVPELCDLHGKSLAMHSLCLALGYLLLAFIQFTGNYEGMIVGYIIQYAILACFFWLLVMVLDIAWHVWIYLPQNRDPTKEKWGSKRFLVYSAISQLTPLIFVFLTYLNGFLGIPSYYFRSVDFGDLDSQKYFIPVVTIILFVSGVLTGFSAMGLKKLNKVKNQFFDLEKISKVETMKISTTILLVVMAITWVCEIISFYFSSAHMSPILFFDIINALQGVFIFLLFVCLPKPFNMIKRYFNEIYMDRVAGNQGPKDVEMNSSPPPTPETTAPLVIATPEPAPRLTIATSEAPLATPEDAPAEEGEPLIEESAKL